ncbi:hypothetical protein GWG54_10295 [Natronococcus sp. JC468]|uniref:DUF7344 domain-containing protein n=1 Tax=Natronococcus sp. JC468 TaxID=1961921 RepID=UPI00143A618B|nr:hypothetical protein [Natronococcus sp. JC468]NKE36200.1 hypothetical protein [Natronococcus sp. JC468]
MVVCTLIGETITFVTLIDEAVASALHSVGALAHVTRRRVMSLLLEYDNMRRERLAEILSEDDSIQDTDAERLEAELHYHHLPKLDEGMLVDYDHRNGDVVLWEDPETVAKLLGQI